MLVLMPVESAVRSQIFMAYSTTTVRLIAMWVTAIFLTGGRAALVVEEVDKSWYCRAEGANEAAYHAVKRDGGPRVSRGASQTNQIAGQGKNPKTDRKDNQHRVDGMLKDACWSTHWKSSFNHQTMLAVTCDSPAGAAGSVVVLLRTPYSASLLISHPTRRWRPSNWHRNRDANGTQ